MAFTAMQREVLRELSASASPDGVICVVLEGRPAGWLKRYKHVTGVLRSEGYIVPWKKVKGRGVWKVLKGLGELIAGPVEWVDKGPLSGGGMVDKGPLSEVDKGPFSNLDKGPFSGDKGPLSEIGSAGSVEGESASLLKSRALEYTSTSIDIVLSNRSTSTLVRGETDKKVGEGTLSPTKVPQVIPMFSDAEVPVKRPKKYRQGKAEVVATLEKLGVGTGPKVVDLSEEPRGIFPKLFALTDDDVADDPMAVRRIAGWLESDWWEVNEEFGDEVEAMATLRRVVARPWQDGHGVMQRWTLLDPTRVLSERGKPIWGALTQRGLDLLLARGYGGDSVRRGVMSFFQLAGDPRGRVEWLYSWQGLDHALTQNWVGRNAASSAKGGR